MTKPIQIFRAGRHTPMVGAPLEFSESDLAATAAAYDPALHEAPLVIGHPKHDAPAWGWVSGLTAQHGALNAEPKQIDAQFAEMVSAGRFKKISASFYHPASPLNPKPGVYYLRHVGFLGAQPPAVKGLKQVEFADADDSIVTIEFADPDDLMVVGLFRRLRDFMIGQFGQLTADTVLPSDALDALQTSAATEPDDDDPTNQPDFSEHNHSQEEQLMADKTAAAQFAEREQTLTAREQELTNREAKVKEAEAERGRQAAVDFAEGLIKEGKLLPRQKDGVVAVLGAIDAEQAIEFGEGDDKYKGTTSDWLCKFLSDMPKQVDFSEHSAADDEAQATVNFAAPAGYHVDQGRLAIHKKVQAYQTKHSVDYATALKALGH
ncbi:MAG: peptidase [Halothiobacillus sp.]